ncbi:MAG: tryptophan-rich sensory protein [Kiritimatiellae bacterium]|nr:tryptophan-rich sensory protein [Kiritimatiellia bacterium]
MLRSAFSFLAWLALCFLAAAIGRVASINASDFYAQLAQPVWAPPAGVFGPVWTVLYTLMGISVWLVWRRNGFKEAPVALTLFLVQLALNALWTWVFFHWQLGALSFLTICVLWLLILATILAFKQHHILASSLLIPYLLWVSFATMLTYSLWRNNPGVL